MSQTVSVVVPVRNERQRLPSLLTALHGQTHLPDEVIFVDSGSTDSTADWLREQAAQQPFALRVESISQASIPAALNAGIAAAQGDIIIRLDGHCAPYPDYIARCLAVLIESEAANVGGLWDVQPGAVGPIAAGIALAVSSPLGAGDALYRVGAGRGAANTDTVPFGCFERTTWQALGGYDETLLTNEDYEFNLRIRQTGGMVRFDPSIRCIYYARPTWGALARQYWRYGRWKIVMLRRNPGALKLRQAIPLLWSGVGLLCLLAAVILLALGHVWLGLVAISPWGLYTGALLLGAAQAARWQPTKILPTAAAYPIIHFSWGWGSWFSLLFGGPANKNR